MKKVLIACLAVAAVFAFANSASAVTCTSDQHPAATLLVPYFQVSYDDSGNLVSTGVGARDTIVTIANASSAPMIAHVSVFDRNSSFLLDFNVALTGFDVQAMRVSDILAGNLPSAGATVGGGVCQKEGGGVYPSGFLRVNPPSPATPLDNSRAISDYPSPAFSTAFSQTQLITPLRTNCNGGTDALAVGYMTIDMANYCNLSNPSDPAYWQNNAAGMENNLFGEVIFTSGLGLPTYGLSTINLEADSAFGLAAQSTATPVRTFYARYWNDGGNGGITGTTTGGPTCANCGSGNPTTDLNMSSPWNIGYGDMREPLGLRYGARWFNLLDATGGSILTSNFQVWRGPYDGATCAVPGPTVVLTFFDEDENTITQGGCISPCSTTVDNFPLETQQTNINAFGHPDAAAGWVSMNFLNLVQGSVFDQAWVAYTFEGNIALESILVPGTQLDPSTCNPLGTETSTYTIVPAVPAVPTGLGI